MSHQPRQTPHELRRGEYLVSTDRSRLDLRAIHAFLTHAYWSEGVPYATVERGIANSLPFGAYSSDGSLAGFARVITDFASFAYLADVFVLEAHRGNGLGKLLMEAVLSHPELHGMRRWLLFTRDAHGLYAQFGFRPTDRADRRIMDRFDPEVYNRPAPEQP